MPTWAYSFFNNFYHMNVTEVDGIPTIHEKYTEIARTVAGRHDTAMVVDADRHWAQSPVPGRFRNDCIHLTEKGHADLASLLIEKCSEQVDQIVTSRGLVGQSVDTWSSKP